MRAYLYVAKLYVQLQVTSAIILHSLHLDTVVDSRTQSYTCLLNQFFTIPAVLILGFALKQKFPQEHVKRGKKAVTAHTDKSFCYTLTSFLLDYQIMILGKILSVVNFGLCNKSAVVEKKLYEQSSRV